VCGGHLDDLILLQVRLSPHLAVMACYHGITVRTERACQEWIPRG
jgi:hypothetical protein